MLSLYHTKSLCLSLIFDITETTMYLLFSVPEFTRNSHRAHNSQETLVCLLAVATPP